MRTQQFLLRMRWSSLLLAAFSLSSTSAVFAQNAASPLQLSSSALKFSSIAAGSTSLASLTLKNTGHASISIDSIALHEGDENAFSLSSACGQALAAGASCTASVTFSPLTPGQYAAELEVTSSDGSAQVPMEATATPPTITIDTSSATDWKINNGVFAIDFNPGAGNIYSMTMNSTGDQMVDTTNLNSNGQPKGFYMDNSGFGTASATTTGYANVPADGDMPGYLDWWVTYTSGSTLAYTYSEHWVVTAGDPGLHVYFVANHSTSDIAGSIGQVQWVFRDSLTAFTNTYSVDASVNNPGVTTVPLPSSSEMFSTDPGRDVQDATVDLHGFALPAGFTREFYTKYDHAGYEYLHRAHGLYGGKYGIWAVFPSKESMVGGPTKQDLYFTGNLLMIEAYSDHLDNPMTLTTAEGTASTRLFGPFYVRFNQLGRSWSQPGRQLATADDLYADALRASHGFRSFYDHETQLLDAGYVPSDSRGGVSVQVKGLARLGSTPTKAAWAVLSDPEKNVQLSSAGAQYWADITQSGRAEFKGVIPGTYRLSVFVLGQFGEYRQDGIVVTAGQTTAVPAVQFTPENFGETVFRIGIPDRSSHEFLHGHDSRGFDYKDYWGSYNYWEDFAANSGSVVYNATAGPAGAATNNWEAWNYDHWGVFDPGLYDATNDTTDNYENTIPSYVASLSGASGSNGVSTRTPVWTVHFATPADAANYSYAVLSVALACDYGSYVVKLNGTTRTWGYRSTVASDCSVRSGLSGYYQWVVFQFPASALSAAGADNVMTIGVSQTYGAMDDALRLELTNTSAAPTSTNWYDYEYVSTSSTSSTSNNVAADDAVNNP
ncbi:choice-of-anchor D domain-containing protein [Silvibacterium dinghuense]|uniref:Choice-of-anchor D domain-containing protein n=1 Tax=Silvibacterium dinghuense TaxID=1560006 RepID=A0A4Q1SCT8_9BACT|nr:choice-of-anchor D domain-containing protein [Silvibacterium dinghuense]RXS95024.1 choice-of-anchor D domain-containing protein [Silvibacterium dinghuense]GGH09969.1 hypothetical protein GCM10011586_28090 [Silvibacterium dinghuense]